MAHALSSATATPPAAPGPGPVASAIERYFDVSLFLLIVTGFVTLTSTGRVDMPTTLAVSAALLFRAWLLLRRRAVVIPERWTSLFTVVYVLFYAADLFLVSGSFVAASVHLVLFSMVVKIFSVQRDRDHLYLAILSFLEVLAAAILTVDSVFLVAFCVFMLLAVTTFMAMEMKRSAASSAGAPVSPLGLRRMELALSSMGAVLMLAIFAAAGAIFFILPRLSAGYLSAYGPRNEFVTGFSDRVELGEIGRIKQSDSVVMHITVENDRGGLDLKWRGIALTNFDGKQWFNPVSQAVDLRSPDGRFNLLQSQVRLRNLPDYWNAQARSYRVLRYRVVMEPIGTTTLFFASVPASLQSRIRELGLDDGGSLFNNDRGRMTESYQASSLLPRPSAAQLRMESGRYPPDITLTYLQLPDLDARISELARQVTAGARTDFDRARAIEDYLRSHYGYTLQMPGTPPVDPVAYFLFERKQGHCEYFASAMAVMLRTLGIPARIVNGFRTGEYNDVTGSYIIRGRDAHSWVEAYIPGYAWVDFDPTPPDPKATQGDWNRFLLYLDAAREFWREWVINYDFSHQQMLGATATLRSRRFADEARLWVRRRYVGLLEQARRAQQRVSRQPLQVGGAWLLGFAALLLLCNLKRLWRALRRQQVSRQPRRAPATAASIWYERLLRQLAREGFAKRPGQTPKEYTATIADAELRRSVGEFTEHYERARFGESAEDAERLPELYEEIRGK